MLEAGNYISGYSFYKVVLKIIIHSQANLKINIIMKQPKSKIPSINNYLMIKSFPGFQMLALDMQVDLARKTF